MSGKYDHFSNTYSYNPLVYAGGRSYGPRIYRRGEKIAADGTRGERIGEIRLGASSRCPIHLPLSKGVTFNHSEHIFVLSTLVRIMVSTAINGNARTALGAIYSSGKI